MKKEIETQLRALYKDVPPLPNKNGMTNTIIQAQKLLNHNKSGIPFTLFFFIQFGFIRKKVWLIQFVIILICGFKLISFLNEIEAIAMLSAVAPLIVLAGIFELSRSYVHKMVEIELSTRYSFKQLMLTRIAILGLVDIFCITIILLMSGIYLSLKMYTIILYICVPFLITCFGCLWILNHTNHRECNYFCFSFGLFVSFAIGIITYQYPQVYELSAVWCWIIMFIIALIGVLMEGFTTIKMCSQKINTVKLYSL